MKDNSCSKRSPSLCPLDKHLSTTSAFHVESWPGEPEMGNVTFNAQPGGAVVRALGSLHLTVFLKRESISLSSCLAVRQETVAIHDLRVSLLEQSPS